MEVLDNLLYTEDHEWLRVENNKVYIGITDFAQSELGDIIFVELPSIDDNVDSGGTIGTIEAVKTVADVYTPVKGKIIEKAIAAIAIWAPFSSKKLAIAFPNEDGSPLLCSFLNV